MAVIGAVAYYSHDLRSNPNVLGCHCLGQQEQVWPSPSTLKRIPTVGEDADATSPRIKAPRHDPAPVERWEQWSKDAMQTIGICESREALERVQVTHRARLTAVARERRDLYDAIGEAFSSRTRALAPKAEQKPGRRSKTPATKRPGGAKSQTAKPDPELVNA